MLGTERLALSFQQAKSQFTAKLLEQLQSCIPVLRDLCCKRALCMMVTLWHWVLNEAPVIGDSFQRLQCLKTVAHETEQSSLPETVIKPLCLHALPSGTEIL